NDDNTDNYFLEECLRYTTIEDDEPMTCPLCNEYDKAL
ncbi:MAG TPA: D-lyxose/D-mannose family sugar isomerase, partial [Candidatus Pullichristensenella stercoripullorum]|nr:D-lyxose/D-mannose family sugar isomerase [Candidatus Pullichristensenella stercoripullorum]